MTLFVALKRHFSIQKTYKTWYNFGMSKKAKNILKDVNATMSLEGMPLSDIETELFAKVIDGEITREEAFALFNSIIGING